MDSNIGGNPISPFKAIPKHLIFALIMGIDSYASPIVGNLHGAKADAEEVRRFLVEDHGLPEDNILFLVNEDATRSAIVKAFGRLRADDKITRGAPIVIYYAGHGALVPTPTEWLDPGDEQSFTKLILPHDVRMKQPPGSPDDEIRGIPDRTLTALTTLIAKEKGNNITMILDCCHAASASRADPDTLARTFPVPPEISPKLDSTIVHAAEATLTLMHPEPSTPTVDDSDEPSNSDRSPPLLGKSNIPISFEVDGENSHTLLAACGSEELAYESGGRGRFTTALMDSLRTTFLNGDPCSYEGLIWRLAPLPSQTPHCEGPNRKRLIFTSTPYEFDQNFFNLKVSGAKGDGVITIDVGMTLGVTVGMQFHVYSVKNPKSTPLGTVTVREVKQISSTVERDAPFTIPTLAYASRNERLVGDRLKVHFDEPKDDEERNFIQNLLAKISKTCDIVTGDNTQAELFVKFDQEDGPRHLHLDINSPAVTLYNNSTSFPIPADVPLDVDKASKVLEASQRFFSCLKIAHPNGKLRTAVKIAVHRVKPIAGKSSRSISMTGDDVGQSFVPVGDNLMDFGGTVHLSAKDHGLYGIILENETNRDLYAYVFYCDAADFTIEQLEPQFSTGGGSSDYNLARKTALQIGVGGTGSLPRNYPLSEGQELNVGFLKIFLSTQELPVDVLNQSVPFGLSGLALDLRKPGAHGTASPSIPQNMFIAAMSMPVNIDVKLWDTILVPIIIQ